jgi:hypothetical protein
MIMHSASQLIFLCSIVCFVFLQFNIQRLAFEEGHGVETLEEAKSALWKVLEKVKLNLQK